MILCLGCFKKYRSKYLNYNFVNMRLGGRTNQSLSNIINQNIDIYNVWKKYGYKTPPLFL